MNQLGSCKSDEARKILLGIGNPPAPGEVLEQKFISTPEPLQRQGLYTEKKRKKKKKQVGRMVWLASQPKGKRWARV